MALSTAEALSLLSNHPDAISGMGSGTTAFGINNKGQVVGLFEDSKGFHGFVDTNGVFTTVDDPNATGGTAIFDINDSGQIVGYYTERLTSYAPGYPEHGFIATPIFEPSNASVSSSLTSSVFGHAVTFTAIVPSGATGTVTFAVDGVNQATVPVAGSQAQFTTSSLSPGTHSVTVNYSGDSTFAPSSAGLTLTVNQAVLNSRSFAATTGSDANDCSVTTYCRTLASALASTSPGGEVVIVSSGGYGPVTITQPLVITAIGADASITATSGNALTINTAGNVTITGLDLNGGGTGTDGILVQAVGFLRLNNAQIQNFANNGIEFVAASGNLAVYDSKINDSGHDGLLLQATGAQAYVHNTNFDNNAFAGADSVLGSMTIAESAAHNNRYGFYADGGTVSLTSDSAIFNTYGLAANSSGTVSFANCLISDNTTAWSVAAGGTMSDTSPGTNLITPGQATVGTLAIATVLQ
jgi:probable HAF family extracellular repeat protein